MTLLSIAIDGPAGAGKSTVAREVARRLDILYIDTGAMYRGVAWLVHELGVSPTDPSALAEMLSRHPLRWQPGQDGSLEVYAEDRNITAALRSPAVSELVSAVSVHAEVRRILTTWQRDFSRSHAVVMDGRDIGTVVLPNAAVKIFLTADIRERARRRAQEMSEGGVDVDVDALQAAIAARDERDSTRDVAPLREARGAVRIDSTGKSIDQVVDEILAVVRQVHHD